MGYELALTNIIEGATGSPMYGTSLMPNPDTPLDPLDQYGHSCYQYAWWQHSNNPEKTELDPLPTDPPYPSIETPNHYYKIIRKNIVDGFPVILNIGFPSGASPFTYSTSGHYVVAIGAYTLPSGEQHIIIMDPHYFASLQTQPDLGGPLNQQMQTPAVIDFKISDFWNIKWSATIIRNILWNVEVV